VGYYMRYIVADERPVGLGEIDRAVSPTGGAITRDSGDSVGLLHHNRTPIAQLEINVPGDGLFDTEVSELIEFVEDAEGSAKERVVTTLRSARAIVAAQVLFGTGDTASTLSALDPVWRWLLQNRRGLLQADGEGYYDAEGLILQVE